MTIYRERDNLKIYISPKIENLKINFFCNFVSYDFCHKFSRCDFERLSGIFVF